MAMYYKEYDHFLAGIQHALTLPIRTRCAELTVLLDRGGRSLLELHNIFPLLIDNIFGPQGTISWGLRVVSEFQYEDYRQLHYFFSPCGPMFNLIYTLLKDPNIKYEFQLQFLPVKIRQFLEHSIAHPFYSELLNINSNKQVTSLLLNPFDYYFFHFAYHLINPWQQRAGSSVSSWNTVYYSLSCDYILHFLPTDPSANILPAIYYNGKNPNQPSKSGFQQQSKSPVASHGLSNSIILNKSIDDKSFVNLDRHHPRNEIWRSETVLTVFTDMWFHNDAVNASLNNSFDKNGSMRIHYNELPTGEYMRIVRVLIKQLHSFSNSAKADDTPLGELKKVAIPMVQGKFYVFLRNLIHRWPMDGSFRLVLELWLTYIQPWRYPANSLIKKLQNEIQNPDADDVALTGDKQQYTVTSEYLPFIAENLLCYVVIFQQLLPRFARVDLVSPKMSVMLYRITKVFDQPNLPVYLREIEQCIDNNQQSSPPKHARSFSDNLPPLSPHSWSSNAPIRRHFNMDASFHRTASSVSFLNSVTVHDKKWSAIVRQKMYELEGPTFAYTKLFSAPPSQEVYNLITQIQKAIIYSQNLLRSKEEEEKKLYSGFWGSIKYFFVMPTTNDEFSVNDRKKVPIYLEVSINNLKDMFGIEDEEIFHEIEPASTPIDSLENISHNYELLTPERVKRRLKMLKHDGDPDLESIRSDECAFLVRSLYQLAVKINEQFGPQIYRLYHEPTYVGRLCRQVFCPPMVVYKYDKSIVGSPRVQQNLPPRVSLRACASFTFIFYITIGAVISWLFGYRLDSYIVFLLLIFFLYKIVRAIPNDGYPLRHHNYPTQGFGNISFNDSF